MSRNNVQSAKKRTKDTIFIRLNKWLHLWLGLFSGAIVLVVCLTGCIYVFNEEITALLHPEKKVLIKHQSVALPSVFVASAVRQFPGKDPAYAYYQEGRAVNLILKEPQSSGRSNADITIELDPYKGHIIKTVIKEEGDAKFFKFILRGHRFLWLPVAIGRPIVNYGTLIFVILVITGLIWWYPQKWTKNTRDKSFKIKWRASFKRVNLDLHNVLGFYAAFFLVAISLTGVVYGLEWFSKGSYWLTTGGSQLIEYDENLRSDTLLARRSNTKLEAMDAAWKKVMTRHPGAQGFYYFFPNKSNKASTISITVYPQKGKKFDSYLYTFDRYTAKEINAKDIYTAAYSEASPGLKLRKMNYDIHVGSILGFPGKVMAFFASLIGTSLPITGFLIWYGRKFKKNKRALEIR